MSHPVEKGSSKGEEEESSHLTSTSIKAQSLADPKKPRNIPGRRQYSSFFAKDQALAWRLGYKKISHSESLENYRFNIVPRQPLDAPDISRLTFQSQQKKHEPIPVSNVQAGEFDVRRLVFSDASECFAPVMEYIVEVLSHDLENAFLGSLPKQLERAARNIVYKSCIDIERISQELQFLNYSEFKLKYASSSEGAGKIQYYLENCTNVQANAVGALVKDDCERLAQHRYGHSMIRELLGVHGEITTRLENLCSGRFRKLATNEYGSRVLQRLVEISQPVRQYCMMKLSKNPTLWLRSIAGLFILTSCMRCSQQYEYSFVIDLLLKNTQKLQRSKIMKRALVSVVDACDSQLLDYIYSLLDIPSKFNEFLEDKFLTYILIAFMRREYMPIVVLLARIIVIQFADLAKKSYFKLLTNKLVSVGTSKVLEVINESLLRITPNILLSLCDGEANLYYYIFLSISSFRLDISSGSKKLLEFAFQVCSSPAVQRSDPKLADKLSKSLDSLRYNISQYKFQ